MPKLTKRIVDTAEPQTATYWLWCSDLSGFGARVFPSGKRVYYVDYRNKAGQRKRLSLGSHGKLTTEEARKLAVITLGDALKGGDPAQERAVRRTSVTMTELCDRYLDLAGKGLVMGKGGRGKKASTLATDRGRVERHIKPLLGSKLVLDITRADVVRFVRDVTAGKTATVAKTDKARGKAVVEGGAGTATRTTGLLGGIFSFAVSEGIIEVNPARGVRRPADQRRERRLDAEEYGRLGNALASAELEAWQGLAVIRLLALTGCRSSEVVKLRWAEVDLNGCALRLQDSKEGKSVRPLGKGAQDVLAGLERSESPYVFPAIRGPGPYGGLAGAWKRIMASAKLEGVTPHTLRHSFASVAGDLGFSEPTIAAMLGHAAGSVTSRYVHHLDSVLIAAADQVAKFVADGMADASCRSTETQP